MGNLKISILTVQIFHPQKGSILTTMTLKAFFYFLHIYVGTHFFAKSCVPYLWCVQTQESGLYSI